jgi:tetratricopeptide (TPR) repeat protein
MVRLNGRAVWLPAFAILAVLAIALPAAAQSGGVRGVVTDEKGQPVADARVTIEMVGGSPRRFETKTDRRGEFFQIGLASGAYSVTAQKDKLASLPFNVSVRQGSRAVADLVLSAAGTSQTKEALANIAGLKKTFAEGVEASGAGRYAEAIAKFNQGIELDPTCAECYYNIGYGYAQMKDYDKAEAAFKKVIEFNPNYGEAYTGLANVYNAQKKFDLAGQANAKAAELSSGPVAGAGGSPDALFNQGVILWNGGKVAEAKKQFEAVIQANPNHAEAHYQLGMALVNEGNLQGAATEFETYLKLAPDGGNASQAKALVAQLKK